MPILRKLASEIVYMRNGSSVDVSGDDWEVPLSEGNRYLKWSQIGLSEKALSGSLQHGKWMIKNYSASNLAIYQFRSALQS